MEVIDIEDADEAPCLQYLWLRWWAEFETAFPIEFGERVFTSKVGKLCAIYTLFLLMLVLITLFLFKPATRLMC